MSLQERMATIKAKQEAINQEAENREIEKVEAKKTELQSAREKLSGELARTEQDATIAESALTEAENFMNEQGANIDPEIKNEIEAIKAEAMGNIQKFESLKKEIAQIDAELATLNGEEKPEDTKTTTTAEIEDLFKELEAIPAETTETEMPVDEPKELDEKTIDQSIEDVEEQSMEQIFKAVKKIHKELDKHMDYTRGKNIPDEIENPADRLSEVKQLRESLLKTYIQGGEQLKKDNRLNELNVDFILGYIGKINHYADKYASALHGVEQAYNPTESKLSENETKLALDLLDLDLDGWTQQVEKKKGETMSEGEKIITDCGRLIRGQREGLSKLISNADIEGLDLIREKMNSIVKKRIELAGKVRGDTNFAKNTDKLMDNLNNNNTAPELNYSLYDDTDDTERQYKFLNMMTKILKERENAN
jgi:hypothetical protein